jgi:hypothetical protein
MHSDWVISYVLEHYLPKENATKKNLVGIKSYPSCGNYTASNCTGHSDTCHNMAPQDMEDLALKVYRSHPDGFDAIPKMEGAELSAANEILPKREKVERMEQFLGKTSQGTSNAIGSDEDIASFSSFRILDPHFKKAKKNEFMDSEVGPWMEQQTFPHFDVSQTFAYASVLGWNPDEIQNSIHLDAMLVLIRSLKDSTADFVVLMMYHDVEAEKLLFTEGAIVKHISPILHSLDVTYFEPWFVDIALAKLRAIELTEYKRVQVLDVDTHIDGSHKLDEMFALYPETNLVAVGLGSDFPLRAGWFMLTPSAEDFNELQQLLERGVFTNELGWDNLGLSVQYPGWLYPTTGSWEFYGSQLEQGK